MVRLKTRNIYAMPVCKSSIIRISRRESPAHVGKLKNSLDFIVPEGTPVKAAAIGIVVDLKDGSNIGGPEKKMEKHGNFVEIEHANNEYSEYEHLKRGLCVKVGDKVKKGQIIGYSGATGWIAQLGPHLHFMVGVYGKTVKYYNTLEVVFENRKGV
ncbi:MAG: M23 family metallopeptidase [Candidatus Aenigmatarchaeota archaeon]